MTGANLMCQVVTVRSCVWAGLIEIGTRKQWEEPISIRITGMTNRIPRQFQRRTYVTSKTPR